MSKLELISKLWKQHQETNIVFKMPISKIKDKDGNVSINYAHVVLQSFSVRRDTNKVEIPSNISPSVYDFKATIFTYDKNGTPIQYKPIFIRENLVLSLSGTVAKNNVLLKELVKNIRGKINRGLQSENNLLPALSNDDIDIIMDSSYYNGRIAINGQRITESQRKEIGIDPIEYLEPGHLGKESLSRFIEKITTMQTTEKLDKRRAYLPDEFLKYTLGGYIIQPREVPSVIKDKYGLQVEEEMRIVNGLSDFIFNLDYYLIEKLRQVDGASPDGYVFFKTNTPKEIETKEGSKLIYPREELMNNYPLLVNMVGKNSSYQAAVDNLRNLSPLITKTLANRGDTETQIGKRLLKRIAKKNIVTSRTGEEFLQTFSAISPNHFPEIPETFNLNDDKPYKERTDWDNMEACVACINEMVKITGISREKMFKDVKGNWADYRNKMAKASSNTRIPQGMTEELFNDVMEKLPINEWKNEIDKNKVREEIEEEVNKLDPTLPGDVLPEDIKTWLTSHNAPLDDTDTLVQKARQVEDMINMFTTKVTLPLITKISGINDAPVNQDILIEARKATVDILFSSIKSPLQILKMSHDFHANINEFIDIEGIDDTNKFSMRNSDAISYDNISNDIMNDEARKILEIDNFYEWIPLVSSSYEAPNGFTIIPLLTSKELKTEGDIMSHCVGSYTGTCSSGRSRIFTVIDPDYNRTTTLELSLDYSEQQVNIVQNQSYKNGTGKRTYEEEEKIKKARKASMWFKENINDGIIPTEWSLLEKEGNIEGEKKEKKNEDYISMISEDAGYEPSNINIIRNAMSPWKQYMSKEYKEFSVRDFEKIKSIRDTARAINIYYKTDYEKNFNNEEKENKEPSISWLSPLD